MEEFTNYYGGPSLLIDASDDLAAVPSPFSDLLNNEHRLVLADTHAYFQQLASECAIDTMRTWLLHLADMDRCQVEINIDRFGTAVVVKAGDFQLSLREPVGHSSIGPTLASVYSLISCTWHTGYPFNWGLHEGRRIDEYLMGPCYGEEIVSEFKFPPECVAFFSDGGGDSLVEFNDVAFWYSHETNEAVRAGTVHEVLTDYFSRLLSGQLDDFGFPY
jgi:hypothetical protein